MAWKDNNSLNPRIYDLPLVLVGPILRRVEANSVSVFLVLRQSVSQVELSILDENASIIMTDTLAGTDIHRIGQHLFIVMLKASGGTLYPGQEYTYDIDITDSNGVVSSLADPGILNSSKKADGSQQTVGAIELITYGVSVRPSFIFPPNDLNQLRVVHGSCRKPHGGKGGAFATIDTMIETAVGLGQAANGTGETARPHMLFLSGDQIYADDVADCLLHVLMDAAETLMGYTETHSYIDTRKANNPSGPDELLPGNRTKLINDKRSKFGAEMTASDVGKSHLITLGEYIAMYMMVWSDVLWPESLPEFSDVFPHKAEKVTVTDKGHNKIQLNIRTGPKSDFEDEREQVEEFKKDLVFVRKLMANIPSLMMFDDHEITDDWFLNYIWVEKILGDPDNQYDNGNPLAKRIIQNGLSAFSIFQAWGNNPSNFGARNPVQWGGELMQKLEGLYNGDHLISGKWDDIGTLILPQIGNDWPYPSGSTLSSEGPPKKLYYPIGGPQWHFAINYDAFQVVMLDTRTNRVFRNHTGGSKDAGLISTASLQHQIINNNPDHPNGRLASADVTILISPAPVFGHTFMEDAVQPFLQGIKTLFSFSRQKGRETVDKEAWIFDNYSFHKFLEMLVPYEHVVMLSGDVHYGFSVEIKYWDERASVFSGLASDEKRAAFAQLTSSSLKNETGLTRNAFRIFRTKNDDFVGWENAGFHIEKEEEGLLGETETRDIYRSAVPAIWASTGNSDYSFNNSPEWRFTVDFKKDERSNSQRGTINFVDQHDPVPLNSAAQVRAGMLHRQFTRSLSRRRVVGKDNLADIYFDWLSGSPPSPNKTVVHRLWWSPKQTVLARPYTTHSVDLSPPDPSDPKPGP